MLSRLSLTLHFLFFIVSSDYVNFQFGGRTNLLYVPSQPKPQTALFVMLHGCTQDPNDFAKGTNMASMAEQHGFFLLYLQQPSSANANKCWNWFNTLHQKRGSGEPKFISDATKAVIEKYDISPHMVSVSGLSAGAAMSVIMGVAYPDLYCCVGSGAGLEYKAAVSMVGAFTAMSSGGPSPSTQAKLAWDSMKPYWIAPIQTVVCQGTADYTVAKVNGDQTVQQWILANNYGLSPGDGISTTPSTVDKLQVPGGRRYQVMQYDDRELGIEVVEYILVEGMGHAWSGGSSAGTYTDPTGPSFSEYLVHTFLIWEGGEMTSLRDMYLRSKNSTQHTSF